jgi:SAM-dependent methyltransferase
MEDIATLYSRHAERFDSARSRGLMERPYLEAALKAMPPRARVLDLGCGAGEPIARYFIDQGCELTGVDAAAPMVERFRARFPGGTCLCSDMRGLQLGTRFDLIVAWDSFFHLDHDDQRAMFESFEQHAAPHSLLLFTSGVFEGTAFGDLFGDALFHSSLDTEEYRRRLDEHGDRVLQHRVEDPDCGGHTVWLAQQR